MDLTLHFEEIIQRQSYSRIMEIRPEISDFVFSFNTATLNLLTDLQNMDEFILKNLQAFFDKNFKEEEIKMAEFDKISK